MQLRGDRENNEKMEKEEDGKNRENGNLRNIRKFGNKMSSGKKETSWG